MRLFVSGATSAIACHRSSPHLGHLVVPRAGNRMAAILSTGLPWAADNAAFSGFDPAAFCSMLGRIAGQPRCAFVACPDIVGDAGGTLRLFADWVPVLEALRLPVALVGQDGLERLPLPWERISALFLGGSTAWKTGPAAEALAAEAKRRGLHVHMGRVNTRGRMRLAYRFGCDSIDGSSFSRFPDLLLGRGLGWLADLHGTPLPRPKGASGDPQPVARGRWRHLMEGLPGWVLLRAHESEDSILLEMRHAHGPSRCPHCGRSPPETRLHRHGTRVRSLKDRPHEERNVAWRVRQQRYLCRACGRASSQELPGNAPGGRATLRALDNQGQGWTPIAS